MRCRPRQRAQSSQPTASGRCRWTADAEPVLADTAAPRVPFPRGLLSTRLARLLVLPLLAKAYLTLVSAKCPLLGHFSDLATVRNRRLRPAGATGSRARQG